MFFNWTLSSILIKVDDVYFLAVNVRHILKKFRKYNNILFDNKKKDKVE